MPFHIRFYVGPFNFIVKSFSFFFNKNLRWVNFTSNWPIYFFSLSLNWLTRFTGPSEWEKCDIVVDTWEETDTWTCWEPTYVGPQFYAFVFRPTLISKRSELLTREWLNISSFRNPTRIRVLSSQPPSSLQLQLKQSMPYQLLWLSLNFAVSSLGSPPTSSYFVLTNTPLSTI